MDIADMARELAFSRSVTGRPTIPCSSPCIRSSSMGGISSISVGMPTSSAISARWGLVVVANFSARPISLDLPCELDVSRRCLISNYGPIGRLDNTVDLKPYEAFAVLAVAEW